jgi:hypothetical protein
MLYRIHEVLHVGGKPPHEIRRAPDVIRSISPGWRWDECDRELERHPVDSASAAWRGRHDPVRREREPLRSAPENQLVARANGGIGDARRQRVPAEPPPDLRALTSDGIGEDALVAAARCA